MGKLSDIKIMVADNRYEEAKTAIQEYLATKKNDIEAIKLQGLINVNLNLYDEAKSDFEKVVKSNPDDATSVFYLANCYDNLDDIANAEKYYTKVLTMRENYINAYKNFMNSFDSYLSTKLNLKMTIIFYCQNYYKNNIMQDQESEISLTHLGSMIQN